MLVENRKEPPALLRVGDPVRIKSSGKLGVIEAISADGIYTVNTGGIPLRESGGNLERRQVLMG